MGAPFILAAPNPGLVLAALNRAMTFVVSAIAAHAAVAEVERRKKTAKGARTADKEAWQKAADDFARTGPFAESLKKAMELAQEDDCSKRKECPALKEGHIAAVNHPMPPESAAYQARITGFPYHVEWILDEKDFDGIFPLICQLVETKANYDKKKKKDPHVFIFPTFKGVSRALVQAQKQDAIAKRYPPATLAWYFKTPLFHARMTAEFAEAGLSIFTIFQP